MPKTSAKKTTRTTKTTKAIKAVAKDLLFAFILTFLVCTVLIVAEILIFFLLRFFVGSDLNIPIWNAIYQALIYLFCLAVLLLTPKFLHPLHALKTSREELGLRSLPTWTDIGLAPVGFIVYFVLAALISALFTIFPWFNLDEAQDVGFNNLFSTSDRLIAFFALVVVAPIAEEIIFRGFLYGKLRNRLNPLPAILIVSAAFGAMHGQWNVGVNVFALSLVLCTLREITGTTYSGIILHMLKNGLAFYILYVMV